MAKASLLKAFSFSIKSKIFMFLLLLASKFIPYKNNTINKYFFIQILALWNSLTISYFFTLLTAVVQQLNVWNSMKCIFCKYYLPFNIIHNMPCHWLFLILCNLVINNNGLHSCIQTPRTVQRGITMLYFTFHYYTSYFMLLFT